MQPPTTPVDDRRRTQSFDTARHPPSPSGPPAGGISGSGHASGQLQGGERSRALGPLSTGMQSQEVGGLARTSFDSASRAGYGGYGQDPGSPVREQGSAGHGQGAGAGAGLYDTRLTLSQPPLVGSTSSTGGASRGTASPSGPAHRSSHSKLPIPLPLPRPLRSDSANSASASGLTPGVISAPMTAAVSLQTPQHGSSTSAYGQASRSGSRANSMSTHSSSSGHGQGHGAATSAGHGGPYGAVPPAVLLRTGSASIAPTSYVQATGHSPPGSSAASYHSAAAAAAMGMGGRGHIQGLVVGAPGQSSGTSSRASYSRGPSTPSVPALSLTAATPSVTGRAYTPPTAASAFLGPVGSSMAATGSSSGSASGSSSGGGPSLSASAALLQAQGEFTRNTARTIRGALDHSSPNSPWSQLTVHALPVFAGSVVKTSMENLNRLCSNHIVATTQRTAATKVTAVLISDLRDFIASGMLTLKTRLEGDPVGLLERMCETWFFFWTRVLGYIQGAFLPFAKLQNTPTPASPIPRSLIPVRQLLLSGFLYHLLVPIIPQLLSLLTAEEHAHVAPSASASSIGPSSPPETVLRRLQQMALILSIQASYSSIKPLAPGQGTTVEDAMAIAAMVDKDVKDQLAELAGSVKWRLDRLTGAAAPPGAGPGMATGGLSRAASAAGRKRRGWRASIAPGLGSTSRLASERLGVPGSAAGFGRQGSNMTSHTHATTSSNTHGHGEPSRRWGPPRGNDTEEEGDEYGPGAERGYRYDQEYEYDEDEEETIPAQSRNASIALSKGLGQYSRDQGVSDGAHGRRAEYGDYDLHSDGQQEGEEERADGLDTAPSTVTANGTFRLGNPIGTHTRGTGGLDEEMTSTPAPGWVAQDMSRKGSDMSGRQRDAQRV